MALRRPSLSSFANQTNTGWTTSPFYDVTVADYELFWPSQHAPFRAEVAQAGIDTPTLAEYDAEELDVTSAGPTTNGSLNLAGVWEDLQAAAETGDERSFVAAFERIDWTIQPPDALMRAVRLAIMADAPLVARKLATDGALRYPEYAELQKAARILTPSGVIRSDLPPDPDMAKNVQWLKGHRDQYRNQWVAVRAGHLLGVAATLPALIELVGKRKDILYTVA
jgi:hypothetical protein